MMFEKSLPSFSSRIVFRGENAADNHDINGDDNGQRQHHTDGTTHTDGATRSRNIPNRSLAEVLTTGSVEALDEQESHHNEAEKEAEASASLGDDAQDVGGNHPVVGPVGGSRRPVVRRSPFFEESPQGDHNANHDGNFQNSPHLQRTQSGGNRGNHGNHDTRDITTNTNTNTNSSSRGNNTNTRRRGNNTNNTNANSNTNSNTSPNTTDFPFSTSIPGYGVGHDPSRRYPGNLLGIDRFPADPLCGNDHEIDEDYNGDTNGGNDNHDHPTILESTNRDGNRYVRGSDSQVEGSAHFPTLLESRDGELPEYDGRCGGSHSGGNRSRGLRRGGSPQAGDANGTLIAGGR
jgi:hypothetical protein